MKNNKFLKVFVLPMALIGLVACGTNDVPASSSKTESDTPSSSQSEAPASSKAESETSASKTSEQSEAPASSETESETPSSSQSSEQSEAPVLKIEVEGEKKVKVGKTIQLAATVNGNKETEITWTSLTPELVSVSETGLVTGLKVGQAKVKAVLTREQTCFSEFEITVEEAVPESLEIAGYESTTTWVGDSLQLTATIDPKEAPSSVNWASSEETVAAVTDTGLVSFLKDGSVTISASSSVDSQVTNSVTFTVKDTIVETDYNVGKMDYSSVKQDNPVIRTNPELGTGVNALAHFKGIEGKVYMASVTANLSEASSEDTWSRISIGHTTRSENSDFHGWCLSYGTKTSPAVKQVSMTLNANGDVQWGPITNNSQVWGSKLQKSVDWSAVKLTSIRKGSDYYYFVNDEYVWMENSQFTAFNDVDTIPTIHAASAVVEFSNLEASTDETNIDAYLSAHSGSQKMYAYNDGVTVSSDGTQIDFTNMEASTIKENYAGTIGDAFILPANKEATVDFDVTFHEVESANAMVALTLWNNGKANGDCRSICLGYQNYGFTGWNHNTAFPGIGANTPMDKALTLEQVYHVKVTRLMYVDADSQDTSVAISSITEGATWGWNSETGSRGDCQIRFGAQLANVTISNISVTVAE